MSGRNFESVLPILQLPEKYQNRGSIYVYFIKIVVKFNEELNLVAEPRILVNLNNL